MQKRETNVAGTAQMSHAIIIRMPCAYEWDGEMCMSRRLEMERMRMGGRGQKYCDDGIECMFALFLYAYGHAFCGVRTLRLLSSSETRFDVPEKKFTFPLPREVCLLNT